jgi:hypothetical protein
MTGSGGSGYDCSSNTDCAAGCYCADGTCTEAGFCSTDADCGQGYHCDATRASCEPNPPQPTCNADADCPSGSTCDSGSCTATCACATDADATQQGYGWCDETRGTCMTGSDPAGDCAGDVTCNTKEPACPDGQTALIANGCYTGECRAITSCQSAPTCADVEHEDDCLNRATDCSASYTGLNCHTPTGGACHAGDTNCTCSNFEFASCTDRGSAPGNTAGRFVTDSGNRKVELTSSMYAPAE